MSVKQVILREYPNMQKLFLLAALALLPLTAQTKSYVLKAARIFDGTRISFPGLVVVTGSKIFSVGPGSAIPAGAEVIDFGDATLSPGFMDAHTHLSMDDSGNFQKMLIDGLQQSIPEQTLRSLENLRKTLYAGFTTVRDVGSHDYIDVGLRNAVRAGKIDGPRMLVAGKALGSTGGHCDDQGGFRQGIFAREAGPEDGIINSPDQARYAVRYALKYGADLIKTCATGGVLSLTDEIDTPQLTQEELNALVDEAHALRKKTAAHAHGALGAKRAIRAGIDSIEHGTFLDDEALDMMKQRGTVWIPTLMALEGGKAMIAAGSQPPAIEAKMRLAIESIGKTFKNGLARGVIIGLGTDAAVYPHGRNAEEFHQMVDLGMDPLQALRAGTTIDAKLLGVDGFTGSLEAGKMADIVVIPGDPVKTIRNTEKLVFVMRDGVVYKRDH